MRGFPSADHVIARGQFLRRRARPCRRLPGRPGTTPVSLPPVISVATALDDMDQFGLAVDACEGGVRPVRYSSSTR